MKNLKYRLFKILPWYLRDVFLYYKLFGKFPNLSNPQTFSEKIIKRKHTQCRKNSRYSDLADKYKVRNYVCALIGAEHLVPLVEYYIDANLLKDDILNLSNVVIKPNHCSGMLIFVEDHPTIEEAQNILKQAKKWMRIDFSKIACEYHYRNINRKIIVEKMIGDMNNQPINYKFHIFKKRNEIFYVLQIVELYYKQKPVYTTYVNELSTPYKGHYQLSKDDIIIAQEALSKSIQLSYSLEYARVDWLVHENSFYFSEITLTPAAGFVTGFGEELDQLMGKQWELPQYIR